MRERVDGAEQGASAILAAAGLGITEPRVEEPAL